MKPTYIGVARDKFAKGFMKDGARDDAYMAVELEEALERTWVSDAHLVAYVLPDRIAFPRITKDALDVCAERFGAAPVMTCFFADVDNPGHAEWTREGMDAAIDGLRSSLKDEGVYFTRKGLRVFQPLAEPVPVSVVEAPLRSWLSGIASRGFAVDFACRDWTRHFRLPNVERDGAPYRTPYLRHATVPFA